MEETIFAKGVIFLTITFSIPIFLLYIEKMIMLTKQTSKRRKSERVRNRNVFVGNRHINSFDQWGVELGKEMADDLLAKRLNSLASCKHDSSTVGLLKKIEKWQD